MIKTKNSITKGKHNNYFIGIILIIFAVLIVFVYLSSYYDNKVSDINKEVFPSLDMNSFSAIVAEKNVGLSKKYSSHSAVFYSVKPAERVKSSLLIKNHDTNNLHIYKTVLMENFKYDLDGGGVIEDYEGPLPEVVIDNQNFKIEKEGIFVNDFVIDVPDDVEPGAYKLMFQTKAIDENSQTFKKDGVVFNVAIGTKVFLLVQEYPLNLYYKDLTLQSRSLSKSWVFARLGYIFSIAFAILTMIFLFIAFKYDRLKK